MKYKIFTLIFSLIDKRDILANNILEGKYTTLYQRFFVYFMDIILKLYLPHHEYINDDARFIAYKINKILEDNDGD